MITRSEIAALGLFCALIAPRIARADDSLDPLRERFRSGMESYKAGRYADAILVWEAIYRDIGRDAGYRLAFNLGRAYDAYGDSTRAAEHYETYLDAVQKRRDRGEALEANVERQEEEARERLQALAATKGRIRVATGDRNVVVQIDKNEPRLAGFVAYVTPGTHVVVFAPGKDEERKEIEVREGQLVELEPPPQRPPSPPPVPVRLPPLEPQLPQPRWETRTERPFSPLLLWIAGGVTVASIAVPAVTYGSALSTKSDYDNTTSRADKERLASDYDGAKSTAYTSLVVPGACALVTGGLVAWYLLGTKEVRVLPQATLVGGQRGATLGVTGSF